MMATRKLESETKPAVPDVPGARRCSARPVFESSYRAFSKVGSAMGHGPRAQFIHSFRRRKKRRGFLSVGRKCCAY